MDSSGRTPVAWAAARGDEVALKTLIQYDADVNLPDGQGNTPLHHARDATCVDILLEAGADTTVRNTFGHTSLHMVCRGTGSLPLLKRLVVAGVDVNATDCSGETVLATATFNKHVDCAFHLIKSGADLNITNGSHHAPIHLALMSDVPAIVLLLLTEGAEYKRANLCGRTILHYAAGVVSAETIEILKAHGLQGIDADVRDLDGKTAEDLLEEHGDDDADPDFKGRFRELLDTVKAAQGRTTTCVHDMPDLAIEIKGGLGLLKDDPVVRVTPVATDDENEDYEDNDCHDGGFETHSAPVFFDALEELEHGMQVVEIVA